MHPVVGVCPVCGENLHVAKLHCRNCDTTIEGYFSLGRLYHLSQRQLSFVETFIRCEGKITRVEQELGMSYPAVRARLNEVIRALGYEVGETDRDTISDDERREILRRVSEGEITAEDAIDRLRGE